MHVLFGILLGIPIGILTMMIATWLPAVFLILTLALFVGAALFPDMKLSRTFDSLDSFTEDIKLEPVIIIVILFSICFVCGFEYLK